jgi:hypothetical protein
MGLPFLSRALIDSWVERLAKAMRKCWLVLGQLVARDDVLELDGLLRVVDALVRLVVDDEVDVLAALRRGPVLDVELDLVVTLLVDGDHLAHRRRLELHRRHLRGGLRVLPLDEFDRRQRRRRGHRRGRRRLVGRPATEDVAEAVGGGGGAGGGGSVVPQAPAKPSATIRETRGRVRVFIGLYLGLSRPQGDPSYTRSTRTAAHR